MTRQKDTQFWSECRGHIRESAREAFHALPPRYFLAAALLLPVAILACAGRLAVGWAADRFTPQKA